MSGGIKEGLAVSPRRRVCRGLFGAILILIVLVFGCAPGNVRVSHEPTFSKLAGRWSASIEEASRAFGDPFEVWIKSKQTESGDRLVFATVRSDGRIDWSRSLGGINVTDLAEAGDECRAWGGSWGELYRVRAAEYAPNLSRITVERIRPDKLPHEPSELADIEIRLNADGTATLKNPLWVFGSEASGGEKTIQLRRHDRKRYFVENQSKLAGKWCLPGEDLKAVLIIREDGTIDWSRTTEGLMFGFFQLEFQGDRSVAGAGTACCKLVKAEYDTESSRIVVRISHARDSQCEFELAAKWIDNDWIVVKATGASSGERTQKWKGVLRRNDDARERGSVFALMSVD